MHEATAKGASAGAERLVLRLFGRSQALQSRSSSGRASVNAGAAGLGAKPDTPAAVVAKARARREQRVKARLGPLEIRTALLRAWRERVRIELLHRDCDPRWTFGHEPWVPICS